MPALKTTMAQLKAQVASLCEDIRSVERAVVEKEIEVEAHAHRLWIAQHHKNIQAVKQWSEDLERQARQKKTHQLEEQAQQEREIQRLQLEKIVEDDLNRYNNRSDDVSIMLLSLVRLPFCPHFKYCYHLGIGRKCKKIEKIQNKEGK